MSNYSVRDLFQSDLSNIVNIHMKAFESFFLTSLGESFLKTYYKAVLKSPESITVGVFYEMNLIGFAVGTIHSKGFNKRLLMENFLPFLGQMFKLVINNPYSIIRLFKNLTKRAAIIADNGNYAELLSIGVNPNVKAKGIGSLLIKRFEEIAICRNAEKISLTTDYEHNEKAIHFYLKNGYIIYYEFETYPMRRMYRLIKNIVI